MSAAPPPPPPLRPLPQVSGQSKHATVAGAIAGKVREAKNVYLTAMGIDAVANTVLAIGNARIYLENDKLDIKVQPEFEKVMKEGGERNVLRFIVHAEGV